MQRSRRLSAAWLLMLLPGCSASTSGASTGTNPVGDVVVAVLDGPVADLPAFGCVRLESRSARAASPDESREDFVHGTGVVSVITGAAAGSCAGERMRVLTFDVQHGETADAALLATALDAVVADGADVVNISATFHADVPEVRAATARAVSRGVLVIAAAGNLAGMPAGYPAAYPGVISVGSLSGPRVLSAFSARSGVTVAVPGEAIPTLDDVGRRRAASGTSIAAAVVTARAAAHLLRGATRDEALHAITTAHHYEGND